MKNANKLLRHAQNGFSLLEMSITITIISLLIAATLTGQNIKHRSELTQIISDISSITTAMTQFKTTYGYYPGDLNTATTSFTGTYDGDGNGYLQTANTNSTPRNEELLFWYHLTLSGLLSPSISGSYDGTTATGDGGVMKASLGYGLYQVHKAVNIPSAAVNPTGKLIIQISKAGGYGLFTTKEAYDLDAKYDNTAPIGTGGTLAAPTSGTLGTITAADGTLETAENCVANTTPPTYKLSNLNGTPCVLYFTLE
jgi:prepilin-type N-terminal cleavage/methylation domain-containing protein